MLGYIWERLCMLSFLVPLSMTMSVSPTQFTYLTYWSLVWHALYFTIDKSSEHARFATRLLHGGSLGGSVAVLVGYALVSFGGSIRYGSWYAWEQQTGDQAFANLAFEPMVAVKFYEHAWPVIALFIDAHLNRAALRYALCCAGSGSCRPGNTSFML